jgi:hypothetical protein
MGSSRTTWVRTNKPHHAPRDVKHIVTKEPISSPFFFFWRNMMTRGTTSFGAPSPITFSMNFCDILAFALPSLEDFLDLRYSRSIQTRLGRIGQLTRDWELQRWA